VYVHVLVNGACREMRMHCEFCIEMRVDSNPRVSNPRSLKALSPNHSSTHVNMIGTGWVSITCDGNPCVIHRIYTSGRVVRAQGL